MEYSLDFVQGLYEIPSFGFSKLSSDWRPPLRAFLMTCFVSTGILGRSSFLPSVVTRCSLTLIRSWIMARSISAKTPAERCGKVLLVDAPSFRKPVRKGAERCKPSENDANLRKRIFNKTLTRPRLYGNFAGSC